MGEEEPPTVRVVLDANVVVSAHFGGRLKRLRELWLDGAVTMVGTPEVFAEYGRVLAYPKLKFLPETQHAFLHLEIEPLLEMVRPFQGSLPAPCRDADDDDYLRAAIGGAVDAVVSGDKDLLALDGKYLFPILAPAAFLNRYFPEPA